MARLQREAAGGHGNLFFQALLNDAQEAVDQCKAWKVEVAARAEYCGDVSEDVINGDGSNSFVRAADGSKVGRHWTEWIDLDAMDAGVRKKLAATLEDELPAELLHTIAFGRRTGLSTGSLANIKEAASPTTTPPASPPLAATRGQNSLLEAKGTPTTTLLLDESADLSAVRAKVDTGMHRIRQIEGRYQAAAAKGRAAATRAEGVAAWSTISVA
jgi:hypothetical protein